MDNDQRLTPLPTTNALQTGHNDFPSTYSAFYDESLENKRSLRQYVNVVYKRLPIILAIVILVTAAVAFYSFSLPSIYEAQTEMIIEPRKPEVTRKEAININFGDDQKYYGTQLQLLQNPDLMKRVVIALGIYRDSTILGDQNRGLIAGIRSLFPGGKKAADPENSLPILSETPSETDTAAKIQLTPEENARAETYAGILGGGNLSVEQLEKTNIVYIRVRSTNPALAARVADKVAELFKKEDTERETAGAQKAFEDLKVSIEELKATIAQQEGDLISYMRSSNLPLQEKGQDLLAARLQTLSEQWLTAMDDRRKLESRYNAAIQANNRGEGMNIPDLYDNKVFQDTMRLNTERKAKLQDQIRDIEKQIQEDEAKRKADGTKWTDEHPEIKALTARIESLKETKEKTEREVSRIIERDQKKIEKDAVGGALVGLKSQFDSAIKREAQLLASYENEAAQANIQGQAQTKLITDKREILTNRTLLDALTQRQKEQELALSTERPNNITIQNKAVTPGAPFSPNRPRNIVIALLMSLAAGIGLAFLMDYLDDSVRTSDDVSRHLGLPTLALIPHYATTDKRKLLLAPKNGNAHFSPAALITLEERHSPMAEAYRHLRTSLLFSSAGKPPQTILVTSSQPSEGKTTTAINTAITLAQSDADVIIVDCDLRRPRIHSHFGLENTQGLTNYLSGDKSTENLIQTYKDLPRLKIITSGPIPPNPAELLSSNEMRNLLQFLRGRFKHVILDSPPAISFTDAAILSTLVDGVVLVAMAGKSSIHLMRQFKQRVGAIGARIYGVVLNGIKSGSMEYYYYGSGYYKYYHKDETDESTPIMEEQVSAHDTKG